MQTFRCLVVLGVLAISSARRHHSSNPKPCIINNGGCEQYCHDKKLKNGKYEAKCSCHHAFKLAEDKIKCVSKGIATVDAKSTATTKVNSTEQEEPWYEGFDVGILRVAVFLVLILLCGYIFVLTVVKVSDCVSKTNGKYKQLKQYVDEE